MKLLCIFLFLLLSKCQTQPKGIPQLSSEIIIDGKLDEKLWRKSYRVTEFKNLLDTTSTLRQNPTALLLGYTPTALLLGGYITNDDIQEPTMHTRDTTLYMEHCFEVFFDPQADGLNYYELEINPKGTIWDLKLKDTDGPINALDNILTWDIPLDKVATYIDKASGFWSFEVAIPWEYIEEGRPDKNDTWLFNAMRIDYGSSNKPSFWVWQRTGKGMIHVPSKWVELKFN